MDFEKPGIESRAFQGGGNRFMVQVGPRVIYGAQSGAGTGLSPVLLFLPYNIIPLHLHLHLSTALTRRTAVQSLETFYKAIFFST